MRFRFLLALGLLLLMWGGALTARADALFSDVEDNHIYGLAISGLVNGGAVQGYADDTFKPDQSINRAEFLKIAMAWYDEEVASITLNGSDCYTDVKDEWFAPYICAATDLGIVAGYSDGSFHPERSINLVEAAKIIANTFDLSVTEDNAELWYQPYMEAFADSGLIPPTLTSLSQEVTRSEMAEMIYWATNGTGGPWSTTYEDLEYGLLDHYRVVYASPGASTYYPYLIQGTTATLIGTQVSHASLNPTSTRLAYFEYDEDTGLQNLVIQDLASDETLLIVPEIDSESITEVSWTDDGANLYWTGISYENTEFEGVVNVYKLTVSTGDVSSFETNSWFHCGSICSASPFVWNSGHDYGAILSFNYDDNSNEYNFFYVYNSLGQEVYVTESLERLNDTPTAYSWDETETALLVEYSDGTTVTVEVVLP